MKELGTFAMHTAFRCGALMRFCMLIWSPLLYSVTLDWGVFLRVRAVVFAVAATGFIRWLMWRSGPCLVSLAVGTYVVLKTVHLGRTNPKRVIPFNINRGCFGPLFKDTLDHRLLDFLLEGCRSLCLRRHTACRLVDHTGAMTSERMLQFTCIITWKIL